ncbi:hypothetical protein D3C85_1480850 [compost metagenome]
MVRIVNVGWGFGYLDSHSFGSNRAEVGEVEVPGETRRVMWFPTAYHYGAAANTLREYLSTVFDSAEIVRMVDKDADAFATIDPNGAVVLQGGRTVFKMARCNRQAATVVASGTD